jgi:hypothetical protein
MPRGQLWRIESAIEVVTRVIVPQRGMRHASSFPVGDDPARGQVNTAASRRLHPGTCQQCALDVDLRLTTS